MGCQDKNFILDGEKRLFPKDSKIVRYIIDFFLSGRHSRLWRFNPSNVHGQPHPCPAQLDVKPPNAGFVAPTVSMPTYKASTPRLAMLVIMFAILVFYFLA